MRIICGQQKLVKYFRALKGIAVSLRKSVELCHISGCLLDTQIKRQFSRSSLSLWKSGRNIIITIESCYFLCQVCGTENVMAESRRYDFISLLIICQFYSVKILQHFLFGQFCTQKVVDLLRLERNPYRLFLCGVYIHHSSYDFAAAEFFHQLAGSVNSCLGIIGIQTFLELSGSVCTKPYLFAGKTDIYSVEISCLKKYSGNVVCDHRVLSSHDTCQTDRLFTVADHQHRIIQSSLLAVQGHKFFSVLCPADNDFLSCNCIHVIGMHRLSKLFHNVIGNIYQVVNGADAVGCQTSLHPFWRRSDFYIFYHSRTVSWAQFCIFHSNLYIVMSVFAVSLYLNYRRNEFFIKSCRSLSCNTDNTVAVHSVGSNLIFKDHVVQSQSVDSAFSHYCVFRENINSIFRSFGIKLSGRAKLFNGAHHSIGLHAS